MSWSFEFAPTLEQDVTEAAEWYEPWQHGVGVQNFAPDIPAAAG